MEKKKTLLYLTWNMKKSKNMVKKKKQWWRLFEEEFNHLKSHVCVSSRNWTIIVRGEIFIFTSQKHYQP